MGGMWELELFNLYNILSRAKSVHTGFQSFQATVYLEHPLVDCLEIFTQSLPAGFILGRSTNKGPVLEFNVVVAGKLIC